MEIINYVILLNLILCEQRKQPCTCYDIDMGCTE